MDDTCPCCAARLLAEKAYESAERKASDHERDLIKLRGENATLRAELEQWLNKTTLAVDKMHDLNMAAVTQVKDVREENTYLHEYIAQLQGENALLRASRFMRALGMVLKQITTE